MESTVQTNGRFEAVSMASEPPKPLPMNEPKKARVARNVVRLRNPGMSFRATSRPGSFHPPPIARRGSSTGQCRLSWHRPWIHAIALLEQLSLDGAKSDIGCYRANPGRSYGARSRTNVAAAAEAKESERFHPTSTKRIFGGMMPEFQASEGVFTNHSDGSKDGFIHMRNSSIQAT